MRADLSKLGRFTGVPSFDVLFGYTLSQVMDPEEMRRLRLRRHVFLARYGRQSMLQWVDVDGREVRAYAHALAEFLREENEAVEKAVAARAARGE